MKQIAIILALITLSLPQRMVSCSCGSEGEFLTVAPKSEFIALVKVTKYLSFADFDDEAPNEKIPMSMEVEIIDIYKGQETRKTIVVWGDNGILCRPYLTVFGEGEYYVIAFSKAGDGSKGHVHKHEKPTDYAISICGEYWLKADMKKQTVAGSFKGKKTPMELKDLKAKLNKK